MKLTMLINRSHFYTILLMGLILPSCRKLIEIPPNPTNQLSAGRVFADSSDIIAAVAGVYSNFATAASYPQFASGSITINTALAGDELVVGPNAYGAIDFYNNMVLPDNSTIRSMWSDAYKNIFQMNLCIERIAGTTAISDKLKHQLMGE